MARTPSARGSATARSIANGSTTASPISTGRSTISDLPEAPMSGTPSITIMSALAILATVNDTVLPSLGPDGPKVELIWDPTVALMQRIANGETADGIVAIDWALDELAGKGLIDTTSRKPVAQAVVGLA